MSKCDLSFELEKADRTFRPGEQLRGNLDVLVDANCRCDGLDVSLLWQTHGKGNRDKGPPQSHRVFQGEWRAGERHRYEFAFTMPNGPVTYRGQIINVDWYVQARADIPWAIDPKAETEVLLLPAPAERVATPGYRDAPQMVARPHDIGGATKPKTPTTLLVVAPLLMLGVIAWFLWPFVSDGAVAWPNVAFMVVATAFVLRMVMSQLRNAVARSKLGAVEVLIDPPEASCGQTVNVKVLIHPTRRVSVNGVALELKCEEVAVSGSGTNKTTHRKQLYLDKLPLSDQPQDIQAGGETVFEGKLELPGDAPPTFRADDNKVQWHVIAHVDIPRWPDLAEEHELVVYPS